MNILLLGPSPYFLQADQFNHGIRHIDLSSGTVTTLAGGYGGGYADGVGSAAMLYVPMGVAMDAAGTFAIVVSNLGVKDACGMGRRIYFCFCYELMYACRVKCGTISSAE